MITITTIPNGEVNIRQNLCRTTFPSLFTFLSRFICLARRLLNCTSTYLPHKPNYSYDSFNFQSIASFLILSICCCAFDHSARLKLEVQLFINICMQIVSVSTLITSSILMKLHQDYIPKPHTTIMPFDIRCLSHCVSVCKKVSNFYCFFFFCKHCLYSSLCFISLESF